MNKTLYVIIVLITLLASGSQLYNIIDPLHVMSLMGVASTILEGFVLVRPTK